jgi:hypothetical protein
MADGPNGARGESYVSGIKAACFPCSTALGATFDVDVLFDAGRYIAEECISKSASVLLALTVNVIRSPLGVWHCLQTCWSSSQTLLLFVQLGEITRLIRKTRWYWERWRLHSLMVSDLP